LSSKSYRPSSMIKTSLRVSGSLCATPLCC
jgi:hypothetical protein